MTPPQKTRNLMSVFTAPIRYRNGFPRCPCLSTVYAETLCFLVKKFTVNLRTQFTKFWYSVGTGRNGFCTFWSEIVDFWLFF